MNDERLRDRFQSEPTAAEREAEERAWPVVRAAYERRGASPPRRPWRAAALVAAGAAAAAALVMSPAGAEVREWIADAVEPGVKRASPSLTELPADGRLLVESAGDAWQVSGDGSQRRLGDYADLAASPRGAFVAAASGRQLAAVVADPAHPLTDGQAAGTVRWTQNAARRVADPAWSPSGYRVAYREGRDLHVVAGDGTDDRTLARGVAPVAPLWRPLRDARPSGASGAGTHHLAYVDAAGSVIVRDADSGRVLARRAAPETTQLLWMPDGGSVVALAGQSISVLSLGDSLDGSLEADGSARFRRAVPLGGGQRLAVLSTSSARGSTLRSQVSTWSLSDPVGPREALFAGPGRISDLTASPDGRWLLLGWRTADQWLFLRPGGETQRAVDNIAAQFDPGGAGERFPRVADWCCG